MHSSDMWKARILWVPSHTPNLNAIVPAVVELPRESVSPTPSPSARATCRGRHRRVSVPAKYENDWMVTSDKEDRLWIGHPVPEISASEERSHGRSAGHSHWHSRYDTIKFWRDLRFERETLLWQRAGDPKMQIVRREFVQKQEVTWGHGEHQWIEQRLAYKIAKYGQTLPSYIGVLEFKT